MFVGLDAQLMRDSSFYALFFGGYELSCYCFRTYVPSMPDELNYFMSGGIAGTPRDVFLPHVSWGLNIHTCSHHPSSFFLHKLPGTHFHQPTTNNPTKIHEYICFL